MQTLLRLKDILGKNMNVKRLERISFSLKFYNQSIETDNSYIFLAVWSLTDYINPKVEQCEKMEKYIFNKIFRI